MPAGFVLAIMLCSGDNCDMLRAEPGISYPTYEACAAASAAKSAMLNDLVAQYRAERREADIICLREVQRITAIETPYEVAGAASLRAEPSPDAQAVGALSPGQRVLATGAVVGTPWLRVVIPSSGASGFVEQSHLRAPSAPAPSSPPRAEPALSRSTPTPTHPGAFRDCARCPVMAPLPGGVFIMGSNEDPTERPMHRVSVPPVALGEYVVTEAEWGACAEAGGCAYRPPLDEAAAERRPMANLSWTDAGQYVAWLRKTTGKPYRLPSEAEWEYAARAG
ncbi:MAG TPA: SUMF1/EgtB/PvdO family nonheme iron enzyme, partial [Acetobacteraceae bacterium]|nr:SUMF1/EgtB/PvdO family nonheme iron enzyme [Acetobacteraceae bacterium]